MRCVSPDLLDKYTATLVTISMTMPQYSESIFTEDFILLTKNPIDHQHPAELEIKFEVANFWPGAEVTPGSKCENHWLMWYMSGYQPLPYEVARFLADKMSVPVYLSATVEDWEDGTVG